MAKTKKRVSGLELKRLILRSSFLPDHPEPFRRQMVTLALEQAGVEAPATTVDGALLSLLSLGYLIRSEEPENPNVYQRFHLWMFANPGRISDRPGWRPGERYDLWNPESKEE